jgi:NTE family protein
MRKNMNKTLFSILRKSGLPIRGKIGLALSGGAARGFTHIGVLKALEEAEIVPDFVAGTSAGSLVGALYCAGYSWDKILETAKTLEWRKLVELTLPQRGLVKPEGIRELVHQLTGDSSIENLKIPFRAVAVDLISGEQVVFSKGNLGEAVRASCSLPGIFVPLERDGQLLVDGGVRNNLPAGIVREMGADFVIGVDLNHNMKHTGKPPHNLLEVLLRSTMLLMAGTTTLGISESDCLIQPDLQGFSYHDLTPLDDMVERGYKAAVESLVKAKIPRPLTK